MFTTDYSMTNLKTVVGNCTKQHNIILTSHLHLFLFIFPLNWNRLDSVFTRSVYRAVCMLSSCFQPNKKMLNLKRVEQSLHEIVNSRSSLYVPTRRVRPGLNGSD